MAQSFSSAPFSEPLWYTRGESPYYNESHHRLRRAVRKYVDEHIIPNCEEWEKNGAVPLEVRANIPLCCFHARYPTLIITRCLNHSLYGVFPSGTRMKHELVAVYNIPPKHTESHLVLK